MNINKIIYKAIAEGYPGEPSKTNLMHIQQWIISTYHLIPTVHWDFKGKKWKSYVYPFEYDPVLFVQKIKKQQGCTATEATNLMNSYSKSNFVVKNNNNDDSFYESEEALYYAIIKSFEMIKTNQYK